MDRTLALDILSNVSIASPCTVDWNSMTGNNRMRFCGECKMTVYNLSNMTALDAAALVQGSEGRLCTRYYRRSDGTILTTDCPKGLRPRIRWAAGRIAAAIAATIGLVIGSSGCVMGKMVCQPVEMGDTINPAQKRPTHGTPTTMPANDPEDSQLKRLK